MSQTYEKKWVAEMPLTGEILFVCDTLHQGIRTVEAEVGHLECLQEEENKWAVFYDPKGRQYNFVRVCHFPLKIHQ